MRKIFILILITISGSLSAQEDSIKNVNSYFLSVRSNNENAAVFVDSLMIGTVPVEGYRLEEGIYNVSVANPSNSLRWQDENIRFIDFHIKSDTVITADFNYFYSIRSAPFNASVYKSDSLLGHTPLRYFSRNELSGFLVLKKPGFRDYLYNLSSHDFETGADVTLTPKGRESIEEIVYKNRDTRFKTRRSFIPAISFGAAALVSGYGAIHFKNKANSQYDRYLMDPVLNQAELDNSHKNDIYSMISLGLMQAALAGVIYFLFID